MSTNSTKTTAEPPPANKSTEPKPIPLWQSPAAAMVVPIILFLIIHPQTSSVTYWDELVTIGAVLVIVFMLNVMITVHELGHFWAALLCGMKATKFAVWFGKPIWSKKIGDVEYILGTIPLGGYVALPQMANPEALEGDLDPETKNLPPASPMSKIIVAFAGPFFSFLLALVCACVVFYFGKPESEGDGTTVIGYVKPDSAGAAAGLQPLDKIISIDGNKVDGWRGATGVQLSILLSSKVTLPIEIERDGKDMTINVTPQVDKEKEKIASWFDRKQPRLVGIASRDTLIVKETLPNGPAVIAGLKPGDKFLEMNHQPLYSFLTVADQLKNHPFDPIPVTIDRDGTKMDVTLQPMAPIDPGALDIQNGLKTDLGIKFEPIVVMKHITPITQVSQAAQMVGGVLVALFTPHSNVNVSSMSTPIGMADKLSGILTEDYGLLNVLFIAMAINVNLAMFNLLPLPILDGGHITVALIEIVRRRPTKLSILEPLQIGTVAAFLCLFFYIGFYDIQDSVRDIMQGSHKLEFAPPKTALVPQTPGLPRS